MVDSRLLTAVVGLAVGLAVSVAAWVLWETLLLFLLLPFVPIFAFRPSGRERPPVRTCPVCDYRTRDRTHEYCPRDGHRLEVDADTG